MALFGTARDMKMFSSINKELINDIVQSEIDYYKISLNNTKHNVYGESNTVYFKSPIRMACLITHDDQESDYAEMIADKKQTNKFSFLRDSVIEHNLFIEIGDIIHWNDIYWEIDHVIENKYFLNRNPQTNKTISDNFGWNVSIQVLAHMTQRNKINLETVRGSDNHDDKIINEKYDLYN